MTPDEIWISNAETGETMGPFVALDDGDEVDARMTVAWGSDGVARLGFSEP